MDRFCDFYNASAPLAKNSITTYRTAWAKVPVPPNQVTKDAPMKVAKWKGKVHVRNPVWINLAVTNRGVSANTVIQLHTAEGVRSFLWLYGVQKPEFLARFAPLRERVWRVSGTH